jgi:DNA-binding IclR family transcriptional regulator
VVTRSLTRDERETLRRAIDQARRDRLARMRDTAVDDGGRCDAPAMMLAAYERGGPMTQSEAATLAGVPRSSCVRGAEVLVARGLIRPTGRKRRKSPEFEIVRKSSANVDAMLAAFTAGALTQAEAAAMAGIPRGSIGRTTRALLDEGAIRSTGTRGNASVYELVAQTYVR